MPANTARGFPYPLPTEPVAEGAQAIRNLAEAVDTKAGVFVIGTAMAGVGLPASYPFTLPRPVASGLLVVSLSAFPQASGVMAVGFSIDGADWSQTRLMANSAPGQHYAFPLAIYPTTPALAAGAHNLNLRNDLNSVMNSDDAVTAFILATSDPAL